MAGDHAKSIVPSQFVCDATKLLGITGTFFFEPSFSADVPVLVIVDEE